MADRNDFNRYAPPPSYGYTPEPKRTFDLSNGTVGFGVAGIIASVILSGAWWGASQLTTILLTIEQMPERFTAAMERSIGPLESRVKALERAEEENKANQYTRKDHEKFCSDAALSNHRLGWRCPDITTTGSLRGSDFSNMPPVWDGVTTTRRGEDK